MNQSENFLFEKLSDDLIEDIYKKIEKINYKHGPQMSVCVLANIGQLACGMALSFESEASGKEKAKETHKQVCDAIWVSCEYYKSERVQAKND